MSVANAGFTSENVCISHHITARNTLLNTEDLKELLSNGKSYSVPPYQRNYSWKQEHWEVLWVDLRTVEENREDHYMGTIVLEVGERKQFRVIDGRQRMATLSILILACVDYLYLLASEGVDAAANQERAALRPIHIPDEEFEADFASIRLKNRSTSGKRLRYIPAKIEKQLSGADISDEGMTATIEHILPENPGESGWEHFSADAHERSYERVGNYSLLERSLNGQHAGNADFARKQAVYARSQYRTSKGLADFGEWTEEAIAKRQADMAKAAKTVWAMNA